MKTNDLKKGMMVILRNGWKARIEDNTKGNTRMATVFGNYEEMGSVYAHDMVYFLSDGGMIPLEHTEAQLKLKQRVDQFFG